MRIGRYHRGNLDFARFKSPGFVPHLDPPYYIGACGLDAYFTLTGQIPKERTNLLRSDQDMVSALRGAGIRVMPVTMCDVSNCFSFGNKVKVSNVFLISQLMFRGEGSWTILHGGKAYHNCHEDEVHSLEFINRPILSVYLLWSKRWAAPVKKAGQEDEVAQSPFSHLQRIELRWRPIHRRLPPGRLKMLEKVFDSESLV